MKKLILIALIIFSFNSLQAQDKDTSLLDLYYFSDKKNLRATYLELKQKDKILRDLIIDRKQIGHLNDIAYQYVVVKDKQDLQDLKKEEMKKDGNNRILRYVITHRKHETYLKEVAYYNQQRILIAGIQDLQSQREEIHKKLKVLKKHVISTLVQDKFQDFFNSDEFKKIMDKHYGQ